MKSYGMPIPKYRPRGVPLIENMRGKSREFFEWFRWELNDFLRRAKIGDHHQDHPDVGKSKVFLELFVYNMLNNWRRVGFEKLRTRLILISEAYPHIARLSSKCVAWADDCLLGAEKYEEFLEQTNPSDLSKSRKRSTIRLNVQHVLGRRGDAVDLLKVSSYGLSRASTSHDALLRDQLAQHVDEACPDSRGWLAALSTLRQVRTKRNGPTVLDHVLATGWYEPFTGANHMSINKARMYSQWPHLKTRFFCFYRFGKYERQLHNAFRAAENALRATLELPLIGQGWLTETEFYIAIRDAFPQTLVVQHGTPDWLRPQHFDVWLPRWRIAVEYHGRQHFEPVDFFGGVEAFEATRLRDERKRKAAETNDVTLIVFKEGDFPSDAVTQINEVRPRSRRRKPKTITRPRQPSRST